MRNLLIVLLIFIIKSGLQAQNIDFSEPVKLRVYYQHEHIRDTLKHGDVYKENMLLLLGETTSLFLSYDKVLAYVATEEAIEASFLAGEAHIKMKRGKQVIPEEIMHSYNKDKVLVSSFLSRPYHYEQPLEKMNWLLLDSVKTIEGIACNFAKTYFMGRDWEVWYSSEIPFSSGPWFLHGLPGLIMEANDKKGEVKFSFVRLESADVKNEVLNKRKAYDNVEIVNNKFNQKLTKKEFEDLLQRAQKDLNSFMTQQNQNGAEFFNTNGFNLNLDYGITNTSSWALRIPNPINLKD